MDSISVGAVLWCSYFETRSLDTHAFFKRNMLFLGIFDLEVLHYQVLAVVEG